MRTRDIGTESTWKSTNPAAVFPERRATGRKASSNTSSFLHTGELRIRYRYLVGENGGWLEMSSKDALVFVVYGVVTFVVLPSFVIGVSLALFLYALVAELSDSWIGSGNTPLDSSAAREVAHRMCLGDDARIRG
jgi:hypothetical protein